jgi:murein DD-endopeptidase MepM/ murein hydrolase activator NlpD
MQAVIGPSRFWRSGAALIALGVAASCSVYQPLDQGSTVPWARAPQGALGMAAADALPGAALPGPSYVVRRGDRLGRLADRYGVSVPELAQANDLRPPYVIRIGQVLRVPGSPPAGSTMVAQGGRGAAAVASAELPPALHSRQLAARDEVAATRQVAALDVVGLPPPARDGAAPPADADPTARREPAASNPRRYTVRSGETLSGIASRLDVGLTELAKANDIDAPYRLYAGQQLRLPQDGSYRTATVELGDDEPRTVRLATGAPPPLKGSDFLWPVNGKVVGDYGRIDQWRRRDGIDIAARRGAPVLAAQDGIVAYAGDGIRGYGQMILLRHDQGYITTYAHNATLLVDVGDVVQRGQVIARVGDSGDATRTMLYFELRKGREPIDPQTRLVHDRTTLASTE